MQTLKRHLLRPALTLSILSAGALMPVANSVVGQPAVTDQQIVDVIDQISKFRPANLGRMISEDSTMAAARSDIATFRQQMNVIITPSFLAAANDISNRRLVSQKARVNRFAKSYETMFISANVERIQASQTEGQMFVRYLSLILAREKLRQFQRIYGDTVEIASAMQAADNLFAELGDFDAVEKQAADNVAALVAQRRLSPAVRSDEAIQRQFERAFLASPFNSRDFVSSTVLKINLTSSGWSIERNSITGIILLRFQHASIATRMPDGKCHVHEARFEQKHQGGGQYGNIYYRSGSTGEMLCENVR